MTFKEFAIFIQANRMSEASMCLGLILGLSDESANQAVSFFVKKLKSQPGFFMRLMSLKDQIDANLDNDSMTTLIDCFGLGALDAILALKTLKENKAKS